MAENKSETEIFKSILAEALASKWLAIFFFINAFLTGFLLPADNFEAGYNSHHWDFVYAVSGTLSLIIFKRIFKKPSLIQLVISFIFSGLFAVLLPYLWAHFVLPHGIPANLQSKWLYAFNGPIGQIVCIGLLVGAVRYGQRISNSVAENRIVLNHLRSNMKEQIDQERLAIISQLKEKIEPALESVEFTLLSGAERTEISSGINNVINQVVRPLSHELDSGAADISIDLNLRGIKHEFRKKRFRRRIKGLVPLRLAFAAPLTYFCYINFNLSVISYLHGPLFALEIGLPFLAITSVIYLGFEKFASDKESKVYIALLANILISIIQGSVFFVLASFYKVELSNTSNISFAFSTFLFTISPAVFGIIIFNMRANLQSESDLNNQIAQNLTTARRQLWAIRKKFAREIHGGLQSRLQVLALRISKHEEPSAALVTNFYKEFEDSLTATEPTSTYNLKDQLEEFTEFWSGVVDIKVDISQETYSAIAHDHFLIECLQEVVREAINNAVKHAGATEISASISLIDSKLIQLTVTNNVKKKTTPTESKASLGTSIFKELSNAWELSVGNESTTLSVNFTLS